jgi:hypothetical protein
MVSGQTTFCDAPVEVNEIGPEVAVFVEAFGPTNNSAAQDIPEGITVKGTVPVCDDPGRNTIVAILIPPTVL